MDLSYQFINTGYYSNNVLITHLDCSLNLIASSCLMKGLMLVTEEYKPKLRSVFSDFRQHFRKL